MNHDPGNLGLFLGHFHPLLVHLPVGGLVLLGILELLAGLTRWKDAAQNRGWILGFVAVGASASAACGWMLSQTGGYDPHLLKWHRALGLAVAGGCLLAFVLLQVGRGRAYRVSLFTSLALLVVASHLGGSITHGRDFLTRYAPNPVRSLLGRPLVQRASASRPVLQMQQPVLAEVIQPILRERCSACHGPEKQKAGLRLDTLEGLLRGSENGPVIKPGQANNSPLIQRLLLPLDEDGHMPPAGRPQPTAEEIELLQWWINGGALTAGTARDLKPDTKAQHHLEVVSRPLDPQKR